LQLSSTTSISFRTVLIVGIKNTQHWPWQSGIVDLLEQVGRQTDSAFAGSAYEKVYWIGVIGPHWRYGIKEVNEQVPPETLIDWHHVTQ
jgi:hypothetical protein